MNKSVLFGIFFPLLLFTSCNDSKTAKKLDGTWEGGYTTSYSDGTKEHITQTLTFNYDESRENDNGTFVESLDGKMNVADLGGWDGTLTCHYVSRIEGRWEVLLGTLYLYYNMNSLEVNVTPNDIDLKFDNALDELDYAAASLEYLSSTLHNPKKDIAKEAKKEIYQDLFYQYQQNDEDEGFTNLEVSETEMSFETDDMGRVTFKRVGGDSEVGQAPDSSAKGANQSDDKNISDSRNPPHKLMVSGVEAFSHMSPQDGNSDEESNLIDGNSATAWAVSIDKAGFDGDKFYGPTFTVRCKKLSYIVIRNGYAKSETAFRNNSRASRIIFLNADNVNDVDEAVSYLYEGLVKDTPEPQILKIGGPANKNINKVQMIFFSDGLLHGAKWDDLCISEVEFWGWD